MSRSVALRRSADGLDEVAALLADAPIRELTTPDAVEDAGLTLAATAVVAAARARAESRGAHVRIDHPETDGVAASRHFRLRDGLVQEAELAGAAATPV